MVGFCGWGSDGELFGGANRNRSRGNAPKAWVLQEQSLVLAPSTESRGLHSFTALSSPMTLIEHSIQTFCISWLNQCCSSSLAFILFHSLHLFLPSSHSLPLSSWYYSLVSKPSSQRQAIFLRTVEKYWHCILTVQVDKANKSSINYLINSYQLVFDFSCEITMHR